MVPIVDYGMHFRRLTLLMIRKKYVELDFLDIDFTLMEGYAIPNPNDGSMDTEKLGNETNVDQDTIEGGTNPPTNEESIIISDDPLTNQPTNVSLFVTKLND